MYQCTNRTWSINHVNYYRWAVEILTESTFNTKGSLTYRLFNSKSKAIEEYNSHKKTNNSLVSLISGDFEIDGCQNVHRNWQNKEKLIRRK